MSRGSSRTSANSTRSDGLRAYRRASPRPQCVRTYAAPGSRAIARSTSSNRVSRASKSDVWHSIFPRGDDGGGGGALAHSNAAVRSRGVEFIYTCALVHASRTLKCGNSTRSRRALSSLPAPGRSTTSHSRREVWGRTCADLVVITLATPIRPPTRAFDTRRPDTQRGSIELRRCVISRTRPDAGDDDFLAWRDLFESSSSSLDLSWRRGASTRAPLTHGARRSARA